MKRKPPPPAKAKRKRRAPPIPQEEEIARFFKALDGNDSIHKTRDRAIFRLMYHAGLRVSEVALLTMRDYARTTERLNVTRLKGSHSGIHHLNREEARVLHAWLKIRGNTPGPIFLSRNSLPISRSQLDRLMRVYAHRAGWPPKLCHCHSFKHACCTHLLNRGFNVEQVQDWVGHSNIQNTLAYAKITNARRAEMARMLADWK
jgi:site-specific recombinase XerD